MPKSIPMSTAITNYENDHEDKEFVFRFNESKTRAIGLGNISNVALYNYDRATRVFTKLRREEIFFVYFDEAKDGTISMVKAAPLDVATVATGYDKHIIEKNGGRFAWDFNFLSDNRHIVVWSVPPYTHNEVFICDVETGKVVSKMLIEGGVFSVAVDRGSCLSITPAMLEPGQDPYTELWNIQDFKNPYVCGLPDKKPAANVIAAADKKDTKDTKSQSAAAPAAALIGSAGGNPAVSGGAAATSTAAAPNVAAPQSAVPSVPSLRITP